MNLQIGKKAMSFSIPVNFLRQWCYCPRIVYYMELTNYQVIYPAWVRQGEEFHSTEEKLWQRRNLSRFNLSEGERYHNISLHSSTLNMHGIADMAIKTKDAIYAIEYKLSANNKKRGDIMQLAAYAMLLEEQYNQPSPVGFLVGKGKVLHNIPITSHIRKEVLTMVSKIKNMITHGIKPESSATAPQCCNCEYLNYCNDRL